ncbi:putative mfs drug efflux transporter protein [Rosellinia necatrix]|uniref:Putative mfs drug efflux transporter protein n=1 Tax=Rosellinia necatrix TaxID=77044 RepID=A0A1S7UHL2_ROSNE|nr:putative mfs drug efflux transporter protein [Rosellinia necatrix]
MESESTTSKEADHMAAFTDPEKVAGKDLSPTAAEPVEETRKITGFRWFFFVISTLASIFLYSLDNTIVANIVPTIVNDLNGVSQLAWLSVGFTIGGMTTVLPFGKIYGIYDAKWVYIWSTVLFIAASALCGAAPTMEAEIVGRVFAGAGGNGMYFGLIALLSIHTTPKERPQYLSYTGLCWGLGTVLGPAVGGGFALWTWRWGFYINIVILGVVLPMSVFSIPSAPPMSDKTQLEKLKLIDWVGWFLSLAGMVLLVIAINLGGVDFAWNSGAIIALFVVSISLLIVFVCQQHFCILTTREQRLLPTHLFVRRMPFLLFWTCSAIGGVAYTSVYYLPLYFQFTRGDSAIFTAVRLLPYIIPLIVVMPSSGALLSRWGYFKPIYVVGALATTITSILMAHLVKLDTPLGVIYALEVFLGAGTGAYTQSSFAVVQAVVPASESANGLALMMIAQLSGLTFSLAIAGAVYVNTAQAGLFNVLPDVPREDVENLVAGATSNFIHTLPDGLRDAALKVIVSSWNKTFIVVYVGAIITLLCAIFFTNGKANANGKSDDEKTEVSSTS